VSIRKASECAGKSFTAFIDMRGAGQDVRKTAFRPDAQPVQLIIRGSAIFGTLLICHGSKHETVTHGRPATERQRLDHGVYLK